MLDRKLARRRRHLRASLEALETRRLMAETGTLVGITGNQQNPDFLDETLYTITYATPGTTSGPFLDGFEDVSNPPDTVLSLATAHGVTSPGGALRVDVPQGQNAFWGFRSPNVVTALQAGATTLTYDMTLIGQELNGGSFGEPPSEDNSFNGYAQSNELAVVIAAPTGGFIQRNFMTGGATDSLMGPERAGQWGGQDGTRTITWDLTQFTATDGSSLADFITANNATEARFWFPTQGGDSNGNQGPMRFYFDNFFLSGGASGDPVFGDFNMLEIEEIITLPFVPDTDAIGFNPETGLLHRTSGASSYRNDPLRIGYHDNHFMQTIDLNDPAMPQVGIFNANPEGEWDRAVHTGPYGLPAPFPNWLEPNHRRTDDETDPAFSVQGPNEYHAARDLTWSDEEHLFYVADEDGIFKLTAGGQSTFLARPITQMKGITFFTINGERRLLVSERDGANLWTVIPETGETTGDDPVIMVDRDGNPIPGVLSLVESPDGSTLFGIGRAVADDGNAFLRELLIIDPVTGQTQSLGLLGGLHFADLAFVLEDDASVAAISQVFVNGPGLTGQTSANGVAFRNLAGIDNTFGYPVPAGANQTRSIPWNGGINQVSLRFTADPTGLEQGDLVVRGVNTPTYAVTGYSYDAGTRTGTWTLGTPIFNDKVRLFLDDALVGGLDGEWLDANAAESYPSGDGTVGGDFGFRFNVLRGDATQDGRVNALDLAFIKQRLNRTATNPGSGGAVYSVFADLTADGSINALDLAAARARLNDALPTGEPAATALLFSSRAISR